MDSWNSFPRETPDCREEMMMNVSSLSNSDSPDGYAVLYETDWFKNSFAGQHIVMIEWSQLKGLA